MGISLIVNVITFEFIYHKIGAQHFIHDAMGINPQRILNYSNKKEKKRRKSYLLYIKNLYDDDDDHHTNSSGLPPISSHIIT